jgi:hypothetical protein
VIRGVVIRRSFGTLPGQILFALFFDFDVQENEGMHSKVDVLFDFVVETVWFPSICEEYEGNGLTKIIELETASSDGVHN